MQLADLTLLADSVAAAADASGQQYWIERVNQILESACRTHQLLGAAKTGNKKIVATLVESQADVNLSGRDGQTALMAAARHNHAEILRYLVETGNSVLDHQDHDGMTALHLAVSYPGRDFSEIITCLLEAGAKPTLTANPAHSNLVGETPAVLARRLNEELQERVDQGQNGERRKIPVTDINKLENPPPASAARPMTQLKLDPPTPNAILACQKVELVVREIFVQPPDGLHQESEAAIRFLPYYTDVNDLLYSEATQSRGLAIRISEVFENRCKDAGLYAENCRCCWFHIPMNNVRSADHHTYQPHVYETGHC